MVKTIEKKKKKKKKKQKEQKKARIDRNFKKKN